jgi:hypothetical protein
MDVAKLAGFEVRTSCCSGATGRRNPSAIPSDTKKRSHRRRKSCVDGERTADESSA